MAHVRKELGDGFHAEGAESGIGIGNPAAHYEPDEQEVCKPERIAEHGAIVRASRPSSDHEIETVQSAQHFGGILHRVGAIAVDDYDMWMGRSLDSPFQGSPVANVHGNRDHASAVGG